MPRAACRSGDGDERADFKAALTGIGICLGIGIGQQRCLVVARPAVHEFAVPVRVDLAGVRRGGPVRNAARADQGDALGALVARAAQGFAKGPHAMQRHQWRALAIDVDRDDAGVKCGRQKMQRHHDPVVELPFLGIAHVHGLHHFGNERERQFGVARDGAPLDAQPGGVFNWAFVCVRHADRKGRHVVHEEVGEVLGGHDDDRVRPRIGQLLSQIAQRAMHGVFHLRVGELRTPGDTGGVAANACEDKAHDVLLISPSRDHVVDVGGHGVDAFSHRAMQAHAIAHGLQIFGPGEAQQGREMHQQLSVAAQHIELADVAAGNRSALFVIQRIFGQQRGAVVTKALLHLGVAVQVEEEFLHGIEAHGVRLQRASDAPARDVVIAQRHGHVLGLAKHFIAPGASFAAHA
ncbi:hypothetical protein SDC9_122153 [bioreactor metagenome]|uniref:Uncharacterized protein n=1 Tax=bioreactor metagenome TaxID=1076179 RepID=A0A645CE72_9ZZZZ